MNQRYAVDGELIDAVALGVEELAHTCAVDTRWVVERVEAGLLTARADGSVTAWRFESTQVVRARRLVHLERDMDANPELAALVADLVEEVQQLRRRLQG